jgi:hypothetical protein
MWKMIEQDILQRYRQSPADALTTKGKLRVCIITDGYDTDSPGEYCGMRGMNPMMKTLLASGYDIEWHIVVLKCGFSSISTQDLSKYSALAAATGGSFIEVSSSFLAMLMNSSDEYAQVSKTINALKESGDASEHQRRARLKKQQAYKLAAENGRAEKFEWLEMLPGLNNNETDRRSKK